MRLYRNFVLRVLPLALSFFLNFKSYGKDYRDYHLSVIKIEENIFVKGKIDEGLDGYLQLFKDYDFVFLQDCVSAVQIALYAKNESAFLKFVDKAMKNGLMPRHLEKMSYVSKNMLYQKHTDTIAKIFNRNRSSYLKRIDTAVLKSMYSIYAFDQVDKNELPGESRKQYELRYKSDLSNSVGKLISMIDAKGWIGDRIIGVDQNDIVKELKLSGIDLHEYYTKYKTQMTRNSQGQFKLNEYYFSSTIVFPLILHNGMFYDTQNKFRNFIYNDSFFLDQIIKGNLHPKDLAFFYDQPYSLVEESKPNESVGEKYFGVGLRMVDTQANALRIPDEMINKFRKELYIAPIENDRAKQSFFIRNKMYIGWGYNGIRS